MRFDWRKGVTGDAARRLRGVDLVEAVAAEEVGFEVRPRGRAIVRTDDGEWEVMGASLELGLKCDDRVFCRKKVFWFLEGRLLFVFCYPLVSPVRSMTSFKAERDNA